MTSSLCFSAVRNLAAFGLWGLATLAHADDGGPRNRVPLLPLYQQECSACHVAYPPGLLPAASWKRLAGDLRHHFGTDATLDAATLTPLSTWLQANAASGRRAGDAPPPQDRITRSAWFVREHDEVAAEVWKRTAVRSAANCAACHTGAEQGDFSEHRIHIPR
jgi:Dihaem cytochrome c